MDNNKLILLNIIYTGLLQSFKVYYCKDLKVYIADTDDTLNLYMQNK